MHVSPRVNVPQIMIEGLPLTINQYTKVNWPSLGIPFYAHGALDAEQTWYFRANWGCYFFCAQVQIFLGLFYDLRLQGKPPKIVICY